MSKLSPTIVAEVVAACGAGALEAASALGRSLDNDFALGTAQTGHYGPDAPQGFDGPGLVILLTYGDVGLAIVLPESTGLLPAWYATPDPAGENKLATLAQELSLLLVPDTLAADQCAARRVASISNALTAAGAATDAGLVTLEATSGEHAGALTIVWPLSKPASLFGGPAAAPELERAAAASRPPAVSGANNPAGKAKAVGIAHLPHYSRSLLKIRIPVSVHLATKKETVQEIVELVPGAIIKFEKGCDELLEMVVGGQAVAEGEAVKIGDKFGFRVTAMLRPREHFILAKRPRAG